MKTWMLLILAVLFCTPSTFATDLDGYTFLEISGPDARAVLTTPGGEKHLVSPGDVLGKATITEITENRVVMERPGEFGLELLIVKLYEGKQKIEWIQKTILKKKVVAVSPNTSSKLLGY